MKMTGKSQFTQREIWKIKGLYGLSAEDHRPVFSLPPRFLKFNKGVLLMDRIAVTGAARRMGITPQALRMGLRSGRFPFGTAVKMERRWVYYISGERSIGGCEVRSMSVSVAGRDEFDSSWDRGRRHVNGLLNPPPMRRRCGLVDKHEVERGRLNHDRREGPTCAMRSDDRITGIEIAGLVAVAVAFVASVALIALQPKPEYEMIEVVVHPAIHSGGLARQYAPEHGSPPGRLHPHGSSEARPPGGSSRGDVVWCPRR